MKPFPYVAQARSHRSADQWIVIAGGINPGILFILVNAMRDSGPDGTKYRVVENDYSGR